METRLRELEAVNVRLQSELAASKNQCAILQRTYGVNGTGNFGLAENAYLREENQRLNQEVSSMKLHIDWLLVLDKQRQEQQLELDRLRGSGGQKSPAPRNTTTAMEAFSSPIKPTQPQAYDDARSSSNAPNVAAATVAAPLVTPHTNEKKRPKQLALQPPKEEGILASISQTFDSIVEAVSPKALTNAIAQSPMGRFSANLLGFDNEEEEVVEKPQEPLVGIGVCLERDNETGVIRIQRVIENGL